MVNGPLDWKEVRPFNHVEWAVFSATDDLAALDPEFCGCTKCKADVAAISLVGLDPIYSTSEQGWELAQASVDHPSVQAAIHGKVEEALRLVKTRPRH